MILYHGSNVVIDAIDLSFSKKGKDFGRGFYLNLSKTQAFKMAQRTTILNGSGVPTVSVFELDDSLFEKVKKQKLLKVKVFKEYTPEWAKFIIRNRLNNEDGQCHNYDIVIGPIADDTIGVQITQFRKGYISIREFIKEVKVKGDKAIQYFFGTPESLNYLKFMSYEQ